MGVDSGLPDFRRPEGFWRAYPALQERGMSFYDVASPQTFRDDPSLAWAFYGHRQALYRKTSPHAGFATLLDRGRRAAAGYFVFTSNVDGQFQKAGFDAERIFECHGNLYSLQCLEPCTNTIWPSESSVDPRATLPSCPHCNGPARPNVLMFGDFGWIADACEAQHRRYREWLDQLGGKQLVIIEIGAGLAVPTVRMESEALAAVGAATLIRINPREPEGPAGTVELRLGAREAISRIAGPVH